MTKVLRYTLVWVALAILSGCSDDDPMEPNPPGIQLSFDVQPIFDGRCALSGCHAGTSPQAGLNLTAGLSHSNTVNVPAVSLGPGIRVIPGDPEGSLVYTLVFSGVMPQSGGSLSDDQIDVIRTWIAQGAKND